MKIIQRYEHGRLLIGEDGFQKKHYDAFFKLNTLHNGKYFEVLHNGLKFNQYVGVIQVDGITVQINPKADKNDADDAWSGVLIKMLKACGKLKASSVGDAHVKRQHLNLLEVYFELFLKEIQKLNHQGLIKQYRKNTANVKALKGKLEFAGNIRHNLVHKERFYTTHQVYDTNHLLHQVMHCALDIVEGMTRGTRLYDLCRRTLLDFPEVDQKVITAPILNNIVLNRKSAPYTQALELARLIILNYSPDVSGGRDKMISLLFNMNDLWEEYVLVKLKRHCAENNTEWSVTGQDTKSFWGNNYLQPDIVLKKGNETYIIDTKWKLPSKSASVQDLRQMYAYARFWNANKVMLLYPGAPNGNQFQEFLTDDYMPVESNTPNLITHECKMGFVNVVGEDGALLEIGKEVLNQMLT